jgi:hypothetical protein
MGDDLLAAVLVSSGRGNTARRRACRNTCAGNGTDRAGRAAAPASPAGGRPRGTHALPAARPPRAPPPRPAPRPAPRRLRAPRPPPPARPAARSWFKYSGSPHGPLPAAARARLSLRFLVAAGPGLEAEGAEHGDLLAVDAPEGYGHLWRKVGAGRGAALRMGRAGGARAARATSALARPSRAPPAAAPAPTAGADRPALPGGQRRALQLLRPRRRRLLPAPGPARAPAGEALGLSGRPRGRGSGRQRRAPPPHARRGRAPRASPPRPPRPRSRARGSASTGATCGTAPGGGRRRRSVTPATNRTCRSSSTRSTPTRPLLRAAALPCRATWCARCWRSRCRTTACWWGRPGPGGGGVCSSGGCRDGRLPALQLLSAPPLAVEAGLGSHIAPVCCRQDPPFGIHLCGGERCVLPDPVVPVHDDRVRPYRCACRAAPGTGGCRHRCACSRAWPCASFTR